MRIARFGSVLAAMLLAIAPRPAAAQGSFMFTVTTEPLASERPSTARYAAGYGQQSSAPFGIDGIDSVGHAWSASVCGGPILYATRTGRTSLAARPLEATGNGFTVRAAVAYSF